MAHEIKQLRKESHVQPHKRHSHKNNTKSIPSSQKSLPLIHPVLRIIKSLPETISTAFIFPQQMGGELLGSKRLRESVPQLKVRLASKNTVIKPDSLYIVPIPGGNKYPKHIFSLNHGIVRSSQLTPKKKTFPMTPSLSRALTRRLHKRAQRLERELDNSRMLLKSIKEEQETSAEEFREATGRLLAEHKALQGKHDELNRLNSELQEFLRASNIPMFIVDAELKIHRASSVAERVLNLMPSDYGRPVTELNLPLELKDFQKIVHDSIESMETTELEMQDKYHKWYLLRITPYSFAKNGTLGVIVALNNIDKFKQTILSLENAMEASKEHHKSLQRAKLKAESEVEKSVDLEKRKDDFFATLMHELRNPLAPIMAQAELLKLFLTKKRKDFDLEETAEVIERQASNMERLLDDLLDISKILRNKIQLKKERIDIIRLAKRSIQTSKPLLDAKHIRIQQSVPKSALYIHADPIRIEQIIVNLINNAAKYSPSGSRIWLSIEKERGMAVLRIRDEGIGISREMLPKIFDLFVQGGRISDRDHGGLGIGLSLSQSLAQLHGGTIVAYSDGEGLGSELVVELPLG